MIFYCWAATDRLKVMGYQHKTKIYSSPSRKYYP